MRSARSLRWLAGGLLLFAGMFAGTALAQPLKPWTGGPPPALALPDLDGQRHDLAAYRGKVVLVNFWATWCAPCRAEMPSMERLSRAFEGRPFAILAVNVGESAARAREFAAKLPVSFTVLLDRDMRTTREWGSRVLPASYVIGPDGAIRFSHIGELDWSSAPVRAVLERLLPADAAGTRAALN